MPTCVVRRVLEHAAHGARVVVRRPHEGIAQIGVRVDLEHRQPRVPRRQRRHDRRRDRVLAAEHERKLSARDQSPRPPAGSPPITSSIEAYGNSISGSVKMPMLCTSVSVSSSQSSMCDEATRMSCGPLRVPATYDVVRSSGIGRITTRAFSKSVVVGVVPPNSPTAMRSYSNGRFIHFLEPIGGNRAGRRSS